MATASVNIKGKQVGAGHPCYIVGEIGINHNGDLNIAKKLIDKAVQFDFDAVKFQKRTVEKVYSPEELNRERTSPFGTTNRELKFGLEFGKDEYAEIDRYCGLKGIHWFASPWDEDSVEFLEQFNPVCHKIASACLTDDNLLRHVKASGRPIILSTGMSTLQQVDHAVDLLKDADLILMHTTSTYPSKDEDLNLTVINLLQKRYGRPVGYSGHEVGVMPSVFAAVAFGAVALERHITLDRAMWGSDHAASLEPRGMELLSKYVRLGPVVRGDGIKRVLNDELPIQKKLRRVG